MAFMMTARGALRMVDIRRSAQRRLRTTCDVHQSAPKRNNIKTPEV